MARRRASGLAGLAVGVLVAAACTSTAPRGGERPDAIPRGPHGAATMEYQQQQLDRLVPPAGAEPKAAAVDFVVLGRFIPEDNALTPERIALGRKLYFDARLSKDGTVACATCHDVTRGFTDQRKVSEGVADQTGRRNSPTTMNAVLLQTLFWDGRSPSLDHQAMQPIVNPVEMAMPDGDAAVHAIAGDAEYQRLFQAAYARPVNYTDVGRALAAFQRTLVFVDSPFRRFLLGETGAVSDQAKEGWRLFNDEARCASCHHMSVGNPFGTDNRFHNIGVSARHKDFQTLARDGLRALREDPTEKRLDQLALATDMSELGRFMVSRNRSDIGAFRTPPLLNVGITAPYMHDGSIDTLWDVMDHYNKGGEPNAFLDGGMEPLALTEPQIDAVVAFLFTLTDDRLGADNTRQHAAQRAGALAARPLRDNEMASRRKLAFEAAGRN